MGMRNSLQPSVEGPLGNAQHSQLCGNNRPKMLPSVSAKKLAKAMGLTRPVTQSIILTLRALTQRLRAARKVPRGVGGASVPPSPRDSAQHSHAKLTCRVNEN